MLQLTEDQHQLQHQLQSAQAAHAVTEGQRQDLLKKVEHMKRRIQVGVIRREGARQ